MSNTANHPPRAQLESYLVGGLSDADFETVCGHLEHCGECVEQAGALEIHDPFIQLLSAASKRTLLEHNASPVIDTVFSSTASHDTDALGIEPLFAGPQIPASLLNHPRYRVIRILGRGGMGTVWLAEHLLLNRLVAIKCIHPEFLAKPGAAERLRREMHAAAKLQHANVVAALDAETSPGASFLVTEYVEGKTLAQLLEAGPFTIAHACRAARDAAQGLAHAHISGLIHRDVKPANLIESTAGQVKLLDLGLVAPLTGQSDLTGENMVMGTPDYVSPEQAQDPRSANARSDIYSLGCTLYHLLAGKPPFFGGSTLSILDAHRWQAVERPPGLPDELWSIVAKMLAKRPEDRFASATEVSAALAPWCDPSYQPKKMLATAPSGRRHGYRALVAIALGIAAAFVLLVGAVVYRIQTDQGELVIETLDSHVEVLIKSEGKNVAIIDTRTNRTFQIRSGVYELELQGAGEELTLDLEKVTIRRGKTAIARVTRNPISEVGNLAKAASTLTPIDLWPSALDFRMAIDVDQSELRKAVEELPKDFQPFNITYVQGSSPPRFCLMSILEPEPIETHIHFDLGNSGVSADVDFQEMGAVHCFLRDICTFPSASGVSRHHIWRKDPRGWFVYAFHKADLDSKLRDMRTQSFRPSRVYLNDVDVGRGNDHRPFGALFAGSLTDKWVCHTELDEASVGAKLEAAKNEGLRPIVLSALGFEAVTDYCLVLAPNPKGFHWKYEVQSSRADFEAIAKTHRDNQLRPLTIIGSVKGREHHWKSIWVSTTTSDSP